METRNHEKMPSVGAGISGTGSDNPSANAKEIERREAAMTEGKDKKVLNWDALQTKSKEDKFQPDENNTVLKVSEDKDGVATVTSSVDEATATADAKLQANVPKNQNQTQSLHGVPGETNLTADGSLQGDKSLKQEQTLEELTEEAGIVSGPNPIPNREGNEITKAANALSANGPGFMFALDAQTNSMAEKLKKIRAKGTLNAEDKKELEVMEASLRATGR